jgi:hypothetical protein
MITINTGAGSRYASKEYNFLTDEVFITELLTQGAYFGKLRPFKVIAL